MGHEAPVRETPVAIPVGAATLHGDLAWPEACGGIVLFAHGSGSSRHSPRNRYVAGVLRAAGLATLLLDLLTVGYFGASTGAGAALVAAAQRPERVCAVVSRGGRPDLAGEALGRVKAPTLLIVGGHDVPVIGMNREAMARMRAEVKLEIVPGATHLFEEPGTLEVVARLARDWFANHLAGGRAAA